MPAPEGPPLARLPLHSMLLGLYVLSGLAMAFLAWRPAVVLADASDTKVATLRTLFAVAAAACLAIAVGGFRHEPWARGIALTVHALAAAVATVGLVTLLCGRRPADPGRAPGRAGSQGRDPRTAGVVVGRRLDAPVVCAVTP